MDPVLLIGRYLYSHWVLGTRPGGIESYRPLPQLGALPCDRGNMGGSLWLLRFVTGAGSFQPLSIGVFGPELFQELIPGILVIGGSGGVGPHSHAVFPIANFFSSDEG